MSELEPNTSKTPRRRSVDPDPNVASSLFSCGDFTLNWHFEGTREYLNCLFPLLKLLEWHGQPIHLAESIPHLSKRFGLIDFKGVLETLNFQCKQVQSQLNKLDPRLTPFLFVTDNNEPYVIEKIDTNKAIAFSGRANQSITIDINQLNGTAYLFKFISKPQSSDKKNKNWFLSATRKLKSVIYHTFLISFALNILALAIPFFIMATYDRVITTESISMLYSFMIGVGIAISATAGLQYIRGKILAFIGARLDAVVGNSIFARLLYLQPSYTESATVGAQVARIKDFDSVREFLTGQLVSLFIETPFIIIFIAIIAILGGKLAFIPVVMIAIFILITLSLQSTINNYAQRSAQTNAKRQTFLLETLNNLRILRYSAAEEVWEDRYRDISADAAITNFRTTILNAITNAISDVIMMLAGMATLGFGAIAVLNGTLSMGAMIAIMILVWRVLSPVKIIFSAANQLDKVRSSLQQINTLMNIKPERRIDTYSEPIQISRGSIRFHRVSLRYRPNLDPALIGISFAAEPGEVIAIAGPSGAGKTSLLKLALAIHTPQAGTISIDNFDIRQMDPIELRRAIAYVPQTCQLFYGTVEQNLYLADPLASKKTLIEALELANAYEDVMSLPEGLNTRIRDLSSVIISTSLQQRLSLARAYLKQSHIYLFDEPANGLDLASDKMFIEAVNKLRGKSTILLVSHRPSHWRIADRILVMDGGQLTSSGSPSAVLPNLLKAKQ